MGRQISAGKNVTGRLEIHHRQHGKGGYTQVGDHVHNMHFHQYDPGEYDHLLKYSLPILERWAEYNNIWNRSSKIPIPRKTRQLEPSIHTKSFFQESGYARTAESNYPINDSDEQFGLHQEILQSLPKQQYKDEIEEERKRLLKAEKWPVVHSSLGAQAEENIKKCWTEQGIWSDKWNDAKVWHWKHEEQLDWKSDREIGLRKTAKQKRRIDARRAKLEHDREASRPIHQFWYQLLKEQDLMIRSGSAVDIATPDINTIASHRIREAWERRGIWDKAWGDFPGMTWKHEKDPYREMVREWAESVENQSSGSGDVAARPRGTFQSQDPSQVNRVISPPALRSHSGAASAKAATPGSSVRWSSRVPLAYRQSCGKRSHENENENTVNTSRNSVVPSTTSKAGSESKISPQPSPERPQSVVSPLPENGWSSNNLQERIKTSMGGLSIVKESIKPGSSKLGTSLKEGKSDGGHRKPETGSKKSARNYVGIGTRKKVMIPPNLDIEARPPGVYEHQGPQ